MYLFTFKCEPYSSRLQYHYSEIGAENHSILDFNIYHNDGRLLQIDLNFLIHFNIGFILLFITCAISSI